MPSLSEKKEEVLEGLLRQEKSLPPKYFYDERGSKLFDQITNLPEYYITRTEIQLYQELLPSLARIIDLKKLCVVEFGAGSVKKIRLILEHLPVEAYVPIDISSDHLNLAAEQLSREYPQVDIFALSADYTKPSELPERFDTYDKLGFFPGSSIGNFGKADAESFLIGINKTLGTGCRVLIGVDVKKDRKVLEAAYDDSSGITAAFNLNMLRHLNATVGSDFDLTGFQHESHYNAELGCIQMHLRSVRDQIVKIADQEIALAKRELIHTENSFKYAPDEFAQLANNAGYEVENLWQDGNSLFSIFLLRSLN